MAEPLLGVRVLEVASHVFVPIGGSVLSEWGAEVIKIEHPVCKILNKAKGVWSPFQTPLEVHGDPQVAANGYLPDVEMINGSPLDRRLPPRRDASGLPTGRRPRAWASGSPGQVASRSIICRLSF